MTYNDTTRCTGHWQLHLMHDFLFVGYTILICAEMSASITKIIKIHAPIKTQSNQYNPPNFFPFAKVFCGLGGPSKMDSAQKYFDFLWSSQSLLIWVKSVKSLIGMAHSFLPLPAQRPIPWCLHVGQKPIIITYQVLSEPGNVMVSGYFTQLADNRTVVIIVVRLHQ